MSDRRSIRYFFTLDSPWAYLGHGLLGDIALRHGARVDYRPISLGEVFPVTGGLPLAKRHPSRQAYRSVELQRWRDRRGVALNLHPAHWPLDSDLANRVVVALCDAGIDPDDFMTRAFQGIWADGRDLADRATLARLLSEGGQDAERVMADAASPRIGDLYAQYTSEALSSGVFGSPTYVVDDEPFWGQDRLDLLDQALATGRAPFRPMPKA